MQVGLHVNDLSQSLCGLHRPGHFDGVVTVVNILFNIVRPDIAIFGEKDFQQLSIIRHMVSDLHMPIEVVEGETIRETDGLAKSSRNRHLDKEQRQTASAIPQALRMMQHAVQQGLSLDQSLNTAKEYLHKHNITPDYFGVYDEHTLQPVTTLNHNESLRIFIAADIGSTRLIDNKPLHLNMEYKESSTCA